MSDCHEADPTGEAARHRRRRQHREPGRLLPEDGTLVVPQDDVDPGNTERLERGVERRLVELAGRGVDDGVPGRALDDDSRLGREGLQPADAPGRDRCPEPLADRLHVLEAVQQREHDGSGERLRRDPVEGVVEVMGLDRHHEQPDGRLEPLDGLGIAPRSSSLRGRA